MPASAIVDENNLNVTNSSKKDKKSNKKEMESQTNESNGSDIVKEKKEKKSKSKSKNKREKLDNDEDDHKEKHKDSKNSDSSSSPTKSKRKKHGDDEQDQYLDGKIETSTNSAKSPKPKKRKLSEKDLASVVIYDDQDVEAKDVEKDSLESNGKDDEKEIPENLRLSSYRLTQSTMDSLKKRGVEALFPIQAATFDLIYDGKDVLARAKVKYRSKSFFFF